MREAACRKLRIASSIVSQCHRVEPRRALLIIAFGSSSKA